MTQPAPTRPVLRYHGGKWRLAPWVLSHFPTHEVYVEPFAGAASVLLRKPRSTAEILNDLDDEIVNLFRVLRDQPRQLIRDLELTPYSRTEFYAAYEPADDATERARRLVVRQMMGFGTTGRRKNRTGFRAKSYVNRSQTGQDDWRNYPKSLPAIIERLRGVLIENRPALELIEIHDSPETLFYADPPYLQDTRSSIRSESDLWRAYAHDMTDEDHRELAGALSSLEGMVVLSGYPSELYEELYPGWLRVETATVADGAKPRTEVLWLNESAAAKKQPSLFQDHHA